MFADTPDLKARIDALIWRPPVRTYWVFRWERFDPVPTRGKRGRWWTLGTIEATSESEARLRGRSRFCLHPTTRVRAELDRYQANDPTERSTVSQTNGPTD